MLFTDMSRESQGNIHRLEPRLRGFNSLSIACLTLIVNSTPGKYEIFSWGPLPWFSPFFKALRKIKTKPPFFRVLF